MTDNICFSILKTATQQIIQSAGFEGANNHSIDTLTDIFEKYIEVLGSTVSAYANLNGRTTGSAIDLMFAMKEVNVDPSKLKTWLEDEGKNLTPSWSAQSDPGRLIQGMRCIGLYYFVLTK
jgi:histone H3/H4